MIGDGDNLRDRRLDGLIHALGNLVMAALDDPNVTEVYINDNGALFTKGFGGKKHIGVIDPDNAYAVVTQVASFLNKKELSERDPFVEGELPFNGERFHGTLSAVTWRGPTFNIRKLAARIFPLREYVRGGALSLSQANILEKAIVGRKNILVVGGTNSGKTTFLNALLLLLSELCPETRMLIIQDAMELQCALEDVTYLRRTEFVELDRIALAIRRMTPERITVGEVRSGAPALELLKLWITGHPGGLATIHAESAYDGLVILDQLIQEVSSSPQRILIARAVNLVVYLEESIEIKAGRKVKEIIRVKDYDPITGKYIVENVG